MHCLFIPSLARCPCPVHDLSSFPLQANLPDMRDPRLWMMRCKDGAEAEIMVALTNKFIAKASAAVGAGALIIQPSLSAAQCSWCSASLDLP